MQKLSSRLLMPAVALVLLLLSSCVAKKKYLDSQLALRYSKSDSVRLANQVNDLQQTIAQLQAQITTQQGNITDLQNRLNQTAQEAQNKGSQLQQSQQQLADQQQRLKQLQSLIDQQKAKSDELRKRMSDALVGFNSNELTVSQKNGRVYVSLQESLLFPSGSAVVNPKGKEALAKLAQVLNVNPDISVNIEGHTDSIPIHGKYEDNWALSVARATSIVRILVNDYQVDPIRVIASGHSSYDPVATNSTPEGRAANRRTEIILSPKLDELYKLLEQ
ncbi:flagellar motor protein MotB [Ilyomonas limi]|uniref:Flagellar motor protein MotB n=1 Tax=Ilyomonas limi TaxID=2575867 RepID=A0A4U3L8D0_9BACT|nr:flagellar motor protein MotB [Ilyomonas limi]TKK70759.1 flagellar motor protein MotB [Ilyomonas limi]